MLLKQVARGKRADDQQDEALVVGSKSKEIIENSLIHLSSQMIAFSMYKAILCAHATLYVRHVWGYERQG